MFLIHDRRLFSKIGFILLEESFCKKSVSTRPDGASIFSGHDNLFNVCFQERRTALRCRARHPMAIVALLTVGFVCSGFMLYALFQWTRETVRNRNRSVAGTTIFVIPERYPERPHPMLENLDIFIKMEDGTYMWKAAADSFELAKSTVQRLATKFPGEYMIFSQTTGNKIVVNPDGSPEPGAASS